MTILHQVGDRMKAAVAIFIVFVACCINVVFLEMLIKEQPGIGNLVTFAQHLLITLQGLIFTTKFFSVSPNVPVKAWTILVILYFLVSILNNYALKYNVPMPLILIFRSGALIANMIVAVVFQRRSFPQTKYVSVLLVTIGIILCTVMSIKSKPKNLEDDEGESSWTFFGLIDNAKKMSREEHDEYIFWLLVGIGLLTFALFVGAAMGVYQEEIYKKHGKYPREALFYIHALPLPAFLFMGSSISSQFRACLDSEVLLSVPQLGFSLPTMLACLVGNVLTQYWCSAAVFVLSSECSSLSVVMVLTLRKVLSLLFSVYYFGNEFTSQHWCGAALVFTGTVMYSDVPYMVVKYLIDKKENETKKIS
jgi:UDP-xylose/UDP-N-acetylglucosamine transporter B4